ncbi:hypothetical protein [Actinoplanes subtropicus]|uniref:hypothetical protein n=1 Tax=Actinoplanes subtropicus TaxID=543632 RepID=UPI0012F76B52|nr:hypothetical protein [Actinoplanes subtropicus]
MSPAIRVRAPAEIRSVRLLDGAVAGSLVLYKLAGLLQRAHAKTGGAVSSSQDNGRRGWG